MAKVDLKKELKQLYRAPAKDVVEVDVPALDYLMVDGQGDPNSSPEYGQGVEALFSVAYAAKFMVKKGPQALDYAVMPLEGLWWADDLSVFVANDRAHWKWTMMIMQPGLYRRRSSRQPSTKFGRRRLFPPSAGCALRLSPKASVRKSFMWVRSSRRGPPSSGCMPSSMLGRAELASTMKSICRTYDGRSRRGGRPSFVTRCGQPP